MNGLALSAHISVNRLTKATMSGFLDAARCSMDVAFPAPLTSPLMLHQDYVTDVTLPGRCGSVKAAPPARDREVGVR
jgi:hypothetical protein